jgi:hypothetical protein
MKLWDLIVQWWDKDREHLVLAPIDPAATDPAYTPVVAQAEVHYFRVILAEMFLSKQVAWFQSLYPAVHSLTRCNFGSGAPIELPYVADSTKLGIPPKGGQGDIIARDFVLVPTIPFSGGTVTLTTGLVALTGESYLNRFLMSLGKFADLLTVPQLSAALGVAQPLADGVQDLFGEGNGRLHLGYRQSFHAPNLKSGYVAVVRATEKQVPPATLRVAKGQLLHAKDGQGSQPQRLQGYDYMLLKIEVTAERDDWDKLTAIDGPFQEAVKALEQGNTKLADKTLTKAVLGAFQARELTEAHRAYVVQEIKKRFAFRKEQLKANRLEELEPLTLKSLMAAAPAPTAAPAQPLTLAEALEGLSQQ